MMGFCLAPQGARAELPSPSRDRAAYSAFPFLGGLLDDTRSERHIQHYVDSYFEL